MSKVAAEIRHPIALGFAAYACAHVALFALVGLLGLPMPALFWGMGGLMLGWAASAWLVRCNRSDLANLVAIQTVALAGSILGLHGRALFCLMESLV
jgi:hypothetical protein